MSARSLGFTVTVHAEDSDITYLITDRLKAAGYTDPYFHAKSRPHIAENEVTYMIISLAELADTHFLILPVSLDIALKLVWKAQPRMLLIQAETCSRYLILMSETLRGSQQDKFSGAGFQMELSPYPALIDQAPTTYDHANVKKLGPQTVLQGLQLLPTQYRGWRQNSH